nr:MAG TPA: hypothetical protein [Caudoviricetes sp.]
MNHYSNGIILCYHVQVVSISYATSPQLESFYFRCSISYSLRATNLLIAIIVTIGCLTYEL